MTPIASPSTWAIAETWGAMAFDACKHDRICEPSPRGIEGGRHADMPDVTISNLAGCLELRRNVT